VRYNPQVSGWWYTFTLAGPNDGAWHRYQVAFDPTWTDLEAEAAGWELAGKQDATFAETMADIGYLELWISTQGTAGVDNLSLGCLEQRCSDGVSDGWNDGDAAGWVGAIGTTATVEDVGGFPDGYMSLTPAISQVALQSFSPPWSGDWGSVGLGWVGVDLRSDGATATYPSLRLRANAGVSGWRYYFAETLADDGLWHQFQAPFDSAWSDPQAEAAGWSFEDPANPVSFATTTAGVGYFEIWANTTGSLRVDNVTRCPMAIFSDGFESGDTTAWSSSVP
jgi:hypothetical protein